jgi:hypothetical protein
MSDRQSTEFNRSANYEVAKNTNPKQQVNIDILTGDRVKNIYRMRVSDRNKREHPFLSYANIYSKILLVDALQKALERCDNLKAGL